MILVLTTDTPSWSMGCFFGENINTRTHCFPECIFSCKRLIRRFGVRENRSLLFNLLFRETRGDQGYDHEDLFAASMTTASSLTHSPGFVGQSLASQTTDATPPATKAS